MNRAIVGTLALLFALPFARPALAHGFGQSYNLPVPLWLYLYGAATAVVLSFIPLAMFAGKEQVPEAAYRYPRFDMFRVRIFRALLNARPLVAGLRVFSSRSCCSWCSLVCSESRAATTLCRCSCG